MQPLWFFSAYCTLDVERVLGRVVLITGAATGIEAQAFAFAKRGAKLVLWDIAHEQLLKTAEDVKKATPGAYVMAIIATFLSESRYTKWRRP